MKKVLMLASIFLCTLCFVSCESSSQSLSSNGIVGSVWSLVPSGESTYWEFGSDGFAYLFIYDESSTATYNNHYVTCTPNTRWSTEHAPVPYVYHKKFQLIEFTGGLEEGMTISVEFLSNNEVMFLVSTGVSYHGYRVKGFKDGEKWSFAPKNGGGYGYKEGDPTPTINEENATVNGVHYDNITEKCWEVTFNYNANNEKKSETSYIWGTEFYVVSTIELTMWVAAQAGYDYTSYSYVETLWFHDYDSCEAHN